MKKWSLVLFGLVAVCAGYSLSFAPRSHTARAQTSTPLFQVQVVGGVHAPTAFSTYAGDIGFGALFTDVYTGKIQESFFFVCPPGTSEHGYGCPASGIIALSRVDVVIH